MKISIKQIKCYNITIYVCLTVVIGMTTPFAWAKELKKPLVIATTKPLAIIAKSALRDNVTVEFILPPAQSPHDAVITVSGIKKIAGADLVVWIGSNFEARGAKHLLSIPSEKRITGMDFVKHTEFGDNHSQYEIDPHIWLSPSIANKIGRALQQKLNLPEQDIFNDNDYLSVTKVLESAKEKHFISHHDGIGYFIEAFNLQQPITIRDGMGEKRGVKTQLNLRDQARRQNAHCVLIEPQHGHKDALRIAKDLGLPIIEFDIQSIERSFEKATYATYMEGIAKQLRACFK